MIDGDMKDRCFLCGRIRQTEVHHCLFGNKRKQADRYGLTCHLCPECHGELHYHGKNAMTLKRLAQKQFEREYGHEKYMQLFGKNYLEEDEWKK